MASGDDNPAVTDGELLVRVRAGDDAGFAELYRRHVGPVRRYARLCCRDAHTAEDLTAEVFARMLRAVRGGSGPETSVRAYLLTMVRRTAAQWGAYARAELPVPEPDTEGSGAPAEVGSDAAALSRADRSLVVQAFQSLPERWQQVLWHTAVEAEPVRRVAPRLGLSANATAVLAFRAREGLREAYLQAHVSASLTGPGECRRFARRLGAYARKPLTRRGNSELRRHLDGCDRCRAAYLELVDLNSTLRGLLPLAALGWFTAGSLRTTARLTGEAAGMAGAGGLAGAGVATTAAGAGGVLSKMAVTATVALAAATATGSAPLVDEGPQEARPGVSATDAGQWSAVLPPGPIAVGSPPPARVPAPRRTPEAGTTREAATETGASAEAVAEGGDGIGAAGETTAGAADEAVTGGVGGVGKEADTLVDPSGCAPGPADAAATILDDCPDDTASPGQPDTTGPRDRGTPPGLDIAEMEPPPFASATPAPGRGAPSVAPAAPLAGESAPAAGGSPLPTGESPSVPAEVP
ncbi:sigma-70 family RNA polymerase sigma factor [Streptomyces litchfieldiae]|uniref:Sigma-70 family RNA polymerase sigma factor n=1 Tax=Streptomyces litchfieldiae TaxID=3075543 RepID=A0ABU2MPM4_9ACTN|nr:sigma-70 family RNA polymerase sigma factor [Streptomyces sp. DSM 44938]MDT0342594.1 sigma-70 family RNA polymerase sigma factor [Streptomyces sp. DSM 44938]